MQFIRYYVDDDPVIDVLQAEGASDPDVIGILLTGSRAVGAVTAESDYDVIFIVSDETKERYERENREPPRGHTLDPEINTEDIEWHECPRTLREYNTFGVDVCRVVYDRTGELTALAEELGRMPEEDARATATRAYDDYMNGIFRTLKCRHRGNELGARLEAAQTVDVLLCMLFALERRWPPFGSWVYLHLDTLAGQGWQSGELHASLLDLLTTADAPRHETTHAVRRGADGRAWLRSCLRRLERTDRADAGSELLITPRAEPEPVARTSALPRIAHAAPDCTQSP